MNWSEDLIGHVSNLEGAFDNDTFNVFCGALVCTLCGEMTMEEMEAHTALADIPDKKRALVINSFALLLTDAARHNMSVSELNSLIGLSSDKTTVLWEAIQANNGNLRAHLGLIDSNTRPKIVDLSYVLSYMVKDQHDGFIGDDLAQVSLTTSHNGEMKPVSFCMTHEKVLDLRDALRDAVDEITRITKDKG